MKLFTVLFFTSLVLASPRYYVLRRGVVGRPRLAAAPRQSLPGRTRSRPSTRIGVERPKPGAGVSSRGPGEIYHIEADGKEKVKDIKNDEVVSAQSSHPSRPAVGGTLEGKTSTRQDLHVMSHGKYAAVSVVAPKGGEGHIKVIGDSGVNVHKVASGESAAAASHSEKGVADAYASVSPPGEAHAIGFNSAFDIVGTDQLSQENGNSKPKEIGKPKPKAR